LVESEITALLLDRLREIYRVRGFGLGEIEDVSKPCCQCACQRRSLFPGRCIIRSIGSSYGAGVIGLLWKGSPLTKNARVVAMEDSVVIVVLRCHF
jgi:hypothetical protein